MLSKAATMTPDELYQHASKNKYAGTFAEWQAERRRAQTDLFWLCSDVFEMDLLDNYGCPNHWRQQAAGAGGTCIICQSAYVPRPGTEIDGESIHRALCNAFVKKNPDLPISAQSSVKERLVMIFRGGFKSSVDEIDCAQWIACFPDVRIAVWTAAEDLGIAFVEAIRNRFLVEGKDGDEVYTRFQLLFPEHCVPAKKREEDGTFLSPGRKKTTLKDPTVQALSLGQSTSGIHVDVGKYDDCVDNRNSGPSSTEEQRRTVYNQIRLTRGVVEPYGYRDYLGTPYDEIDAYSLMMEKGSDRLQVLHRGAWEVKKEFKALKLSEIQEHMVDLRFPVDAAGNPRLTYATLHEYWDDDEYIFCCQYLCSPSSKKLVKFTEQLLMSRIVSEESLPQAGTYRTFAAWDFASSSERGSDFSFGSVGLFDSSNRGFVVDAVMDKFAKSELAFQVAKLAARWKVEKIGIEKSPGADFLETDIRIELAKAGHPHCPIEFFKVDSNKDAKESRAEGLETLLVAGRLLFSQCISIMDKIIKQFVKFKPHSKRKDDAVDGIAHLMRFMPSSFEAPLDEQARQQAVWDDLAQKELHDMIYIPRPKPELVPEPEPPATHFEGLPIYQNTDAQIYGA